jgi:hypothetical protein
MKIEINYSKDGKTYTIFKDGVKLVSCDSTVDPTYALESFGIDEKVNAPAQINTPLFTDDYIEKVIGEIKFDTPNLVKTNQALSIGSGIDLRKDEKDELSDPEFEETDIEKLPVKINQKIYVDDITGGLRNLKGGLATINMLWMDPSENKVQTGTEYVDRDDDDEEDDFSGMSEEIAIEEKQVMFGIDEAPGMFFSWSLLKGEQEKLKIKFGKDLAAMVYITAKA